MKMRDMVEKKNLATVSLPTFIFVAVYLYELFAPLHRMKK